MKKSYESHEEEYRRMERKGIKSWFSRNQSWDIDPYDEHFLEDFFALPWSPKCGKAIELGCGTGPITRWLARRNLKTTGVDISQTAVRMARKQSAGLKISYRAADLCNEDVSSLGHFDLCVDGRFFHGITHRKDRREVLKKIFSLLKPGGTFILMSMCSPIERRVLSKQYPAQKILENVIYYPLNGRSPFSDVRKINGEEFFPARFLGHWKFLLAELRTAGLTPMLVRLANCLPEEPVSSLNVAAMKCSH